MANSRTTFGGIGQRFPSKEPGDPTGIGVNTFLMDKLKAIGSGEKVMPVLLWALEPGMEEAKREWPIVTGASRDTIRIEPVEEGGHFARAAVVVGGQPLIDDPRNTKHIDYAPYVEFLGTQKTSAGTLTRAMVVSEEAIRERVKLGLRALFEAELGR